MKNTKLAHRVILATVSLIWPGSAFSQQSKVIELEATKDGEKLVSIRLNDQNLLFEPTSSSETFLFTPESVVIIKHEAKTFSIQSYEDLQAMVSRRVAEIAKSQVARGTTGTGSYGSYTALRLTGETEIVNGLRARKVIKISEGKPEIEIWVSSELLPRKLRAAGERLRSILPKDYWGILHGNAGMIEIIMLFGIPIKIVNDGREVYQARVIENPNSSTSFQVPAGYRKTEN